ncbi:MAG TPA: hypothetical protein VH413_16620 [Verrucomicrobiae bacterium]|jgi:hypothetical protein|nr:hypothetical protein [Verrucomicrobiae bacterium]
MSEYNTTAITFVNPKDALLYFDYVIPMRPTAVALSTLLPPQATSKEDIAKILPILEEQGTKEKFNESVNDMFSTLRPDLRQSMAFIKELYAFDIGLMGFYMLRIMKSLKLDDNHALDSFKARLGEQANATTGSLRRDYECILKKYSLNGSHIECQPIFFGSPQNKDVTPTINFSEIKMIDTGSVTLKKIMEFRKDKHSMVKMRRFRLFVYDAYVGKDKSYVADDLLRRMNDYNEVVKSWGFETKLKAMSFVLSSKLTASCLGASFLSALFGSTIEKIATFSTALGIEIGQFTLELAKRNHEFRKLCREEPISYIADAKAKLEKE